jgi:hypothetical protein
MTNVIFITHIHTHIDITMGSGLCSTSSSSVSTEECTPARKGMGLKGCDVTHTHIITHADSSYIYMIYVHKCIRRPHTQPTHMDR